MSYSVTAPDQTRNTNLVSKIYYKILFYILQNTTLSRVTHRRQFAE